MSGLQEILLILLILVGLFVIPRIIQRPQHPPPRPPLRSRIPVVPGKMRLAILASAIWIGFAAAYFQPWHSGWERFAYAGAGVVAVAWGAVWVIRGFRKRSR